MNVPDWIVGLRHDITHGHMPSLESLIAGAKEAMIWLKVHILIKNNCIPLVVFLCYR